MTKIRHFYCQKCKRTLRREENQEDPLECYYCKSGDIEPIVVKRAFQCRDQGLKACFGSNTPFKGEGS